MRYPSIPSGPWQDLMNGAVPYLAGILLLYFANVALTGWLAGRRGRDDGLWAVFAMFSGPVALLALLLLPRKHPQSEQAR